jgi:hypothetical protein
LARVLLQLDRMRSVGMNFGAVIGLLAIGTACQFVVDVSDYEFDDRDARADVGELQPRPTSDASAEPAELDPVLTAGSNGGRAPALEPRPSADAGAEAEPLPPESEPSAPEPELPPDPTSACSIIEYCYAYQKENTTDEERCIQLGCSLDEAIAECRAEVAVTCGTAPQPPFVMITLSGERVILK